MASDPFVERFTSHAVHARLAQIIKLVSDALLKADAATDIAVRLTRLSAGLQMAQTRLQLVEGRWVGTNSLAELDRSSQEILNQVNNFSTNGNAGHIKQANAQFDDILLPLMQRLPVVATGEDALSAFTSAIAKARAQLIGEVDAVRLQIKETQAAVEKRAIELAEIQKKAIEQENRVTKLNDRADAAIAAINKNSVETEQQREQKFLAFLKDRLAAADLDFGQRTSAIEQLLGETRATTAAAIASLNDNLVKSEKTLATMGNNALTGDYRRSADDNETTANGLRNYAILAMTGMAALIGIVVFTVGNGDISWPVALFRLTAAISLAAFAAYLARESSKHRAVGQRMRRLELELASLDAFIALIPEDQRQSLKLELARKYFANDGDAPPSAELSAKDMLKEMRACVRVFRKS